LAVHTQQWEMREQFHAEMYNNDATLPPSGKDLDKQLELKLVMGPEPPLPNFGGTYPAVEIHITNATDFTFDTHDKVYKCTV
jgi:hypothetical protein